MVECIVGDLSFPHPAGMTVSPVATHPQWVMITFGHRDMVETVKRHLLYLTSLLLLWPTACGESDGSLAQTVSTREGSITSTTTSTIASTTAAPPSTTPPAPDNDITINVQERTQDTQPTSTVTTVATTATTPATTTTSESATTAVADAEDDSSAWAWLLGFLALGATEMRSGVRR
jgi:hypothetical protein